jgi:hypothetical protein
MIILASTSDKLQLISSAAATLSVHADWLDNAVGVITPGRTNTALSTATTADVVGSPASTVMRAVKQLFVRNTHATLPTDVTIQHTDGTTVAQLYKVTLSAGYSLQYADDVGFSVLGPDFSSARLDAYDALYVTKLDKQRVLADVFTFSENDLRATKATATVAYYTVFSQPATSDWDMLYFEATLVVAGSTRGNGPIIGIANKGQGPGATNYPGSNNYSLGFNQNGTFYYDGSSSGAYPVSDAGDTLALAVRLTEGTVWMRNVTTNSYWMNSATADPAAIAPGGGLTNYPFIRGEQWNGGQLYACAGFYEQGNSVRFNFDGPFLGTVPAGYRRWRGRAP